MRAISPPRRQRKVVTALIVLVGRWRIELAEDIGPTWLRSRTAITNGVDVSLTPTSGLMDEQKLEFVMANHKALALQAEDENDGLLGKMRTAQLPAEEHPAALAAVDELLAVAGGKHRLGETRWRRSLRERR